MMDRRTYLKSAGVATAGGLAGLAGCVGGNGNGIPTLEYNYVVPIEALGSIQGIPELQDELEHYGDEYELNVNQVSGTPDAVMGMASGEVDLAFLTTVSFGSAIEEDAVPGGITGIMMDFYDAHPDYYGSTVYSLPDSDLTDPEDLEGQTLGINALGTATHAVYVKMFSEVGLDPDDDVEFMELEFPATTAALEDGRMDAGFYPPLFASEPRDEGFTEVFTSHDAWDEMYPFSFVAATNDSLEEKDDAIAAWADDCASFFEYVQENRSEVVSLAADHFDIPEPAIDAFYLTEYDFYRQLEFETDRFDETLDELVDLGYLDEQRDWTEYITNEYV
ncbi:ABC transporter substrate-binding protein [Natronolimnohabitans innermongolicus]|nr:ABC transporter substrate-binding protein [Natronolimnohabitans innermongolicus]